MTIVGKVLILIGAMCITPTFLWVAFNFTTPGAERGWAGMVMGVPMVFIGFMFHAPGCGNRCDK